MNSEEIIKNLNLIKEIMDTEIHSSDIDGIEGKMLKLCSYMGLSAECLANAKKALFQAQGEAMTKIRANSPTINTTLLRLQLEADLAEEKMLVDFSERINAGIVHVVDGLRTSISKHKEERRISQFQQG